MNEEKLITVTASTCDRLADLPSYLDKNGDKALGDIVEKCLRDLRAAYEGQPSIVAKGGSLSVGQMKTSVLLNELVKARDTFADIERTLRAIQRPIIADACAIAKESITTALAGMPTPAPEPAAGGEPGEWHVDQDWTTDEIVILDSDCNVVLRMEEDEDSTKTGQIAVAEQIVIEHNNAHAQRQTIATLLTALKRITRIAGNQSDESIMVVGGTLMFINARQIAIGALAAAAKRRE